MHTSYIIRIIFLHFFSFVGKIISNRNFLGININATTFKSMIPSTHHSKNILHRSTIYRGPLYSIIEGRGYYYKCTPISPLYYIYSLWYSAM